MKKKSIQWAGIFLFLLAGILWGNETEEQTLTVKGDSVQLSLKALFISIESYTKSPLAFAANDIKELSTLLQTRYGCKSESIIDQPGGFTPTDDPACYKTATQKAVQDWANSLTENDMGLLYLAGHGLPGPDQKLYFPMRNFSQDRFEETTIPLSWFREVLSASHGKGNLIFLDTCFSGLSRDADEFPSVSAVEMARSFDGLNNTATLASSQADQKSWIWAEMKHSLFTYWLISAFQGNADKDGDRFITLDELFDYLDKNISTVSSRNELMQTQNPAILNADQVREFFRLPIPAVEISQLLDNIAAQIDLLLKNNGLKNVMIPEFVTGENDDTIQAEYGTLPKGIAKNLLNKLSMMPNKEYTVFNESSTRELLNKDHIRPEDLGGTLTQDITIGDTRVEAVASGRLNMYHPNAMAITVSLYDAKGQTQIGAATGIAILTPEKMAAAGASFARKEVLQPKPAKPEEEPKPENVYQYVEELNQLVSPEQVQVLDAVNEEVAEPHPMLNKKLPFEVNFQVRKAGSRVWQKRTGQVIGKDYYLPLNKNEEYSIQLLNKNSFDVFAKVLVDGLNTLSQQMPALDKGVVIEAVQKPENETENEAESKSDYVFAPRVDLEDARSWFLRGYLSTKSRKSEPKTITGFYDLNMKKPSDSSVYQFTIRDADESLAARSKYTDQIGLITIAFYQAERGERKVELGTGLGQKNKIALNYDKTDQHPGELMAVYNIRYISQSKFEELVREANQKNEQKKK